MLHDIGNHTEDHVATEYDDVAGYYITGFMLHDISNHTEYHLATEYHDAAESYIT